MADVQLSVKRVEVKQLEVCFQKLKIKHHTSQDNSTRLCNYMSLFYYLTAIMC